MDFEKLQDPEFQEKLKTARTADEFLGIIREEGFELSDDMLDDVSGGESLPLNGNEFKPSGEAAIRPYEIGHCPGYIPIKPFQ